MPVSIDIHENEFLEEIYQEGIEKGIERGIEKGIEQGAAAVLLEVLDQRFGRIPVDARQRILDGDRAMIQAWTRKLGAATKVSDIFE